MAGKKYVCNNAKLECTLCTKPDGKLVVTSNEIKLQDKTWATTKDSAKTNLVFTGNCKKSSNSSQPCASVIAPDKWINTGEILIQGNKALLECSTIKCNYGGVAIKINDHIQKSQLDSIEPTDVESIAPVTEEDMITSSKITI